MNSVRISLNTHKFCQFLPIWKINYKNKNDLKNAKILFNFFFILFIFPKTLNFNSNILTNIYNKYKCETIFDASCIMQRPEGM